MNAPNEMSSACPNTGPKTTLLGPAECASLRDEIAMRAMVAILGNPLELLTAPESGVSEPSDIAKAAYELADAMLAERKRGEAPHVELKTSGTISHEDAIKSAAGVTYTASQPSHELPLSEHDVETYLRNLHVFTNGRPESSKDLMNKLGLMARAAIRLKGELSETAFKFAESVNRNHHLQRENQELRTVGWLTKYEEATKRIAKLEEALKWYADEKTYTSAGWAANLTGQYRIRPEIEEDNGYRARAALSQTANAGKES